MRNNFTGKCSFSNKPECLKTLIIRIVEIIIAFHCTQDSTISFMGLNIVKNSLFVLNHILSDTQVNVEVREFYIARLSKDCLFLIIIVVIAKY